MPYFKCIIPMHFLVPTHDSYDILSNLNQVRLWVHRHRRQMR